MPQVKSDNNKVGLLPLQEGTTDSVPLSKLSDQEASYRSVSVGTCSDYGYRPITDFFTCRAAAAGLNLLEAGFPITWDDRAGCHYWSDQSTHRICNIPPSAKRDEVLDSEPAGHERPRRHSGGEPARRKVVVTTTTHTTTHQTCGAMAAGYDYPGNDLYTVDAATAETCCVECMKDPRCLLWTWQPHTSEARAMCFLKGAEPRLVVTRVQSRGAVSGSRDKSRIQVKDATPGQSLYCFSLVLPYGYERTLLSLQYRHRASIFSCDEYGAYSNTSLEVAPAVRTSVLAISLYVKKGGEFGTALNTNVFLTVWRKVVSDGRYLFHDWTVKVDPDAVFLPVRLRALLLHHHETPTGTYLNNCKFGMHGPIEVLSRNTVKTLVAGADRCMQHFIKLCSGPCLWGEDMFVDQCLMKVLGAKRENDYNLLLEDHCDPPPGWASCQDRVVVSFHPYKSKEGYRRCLANATAA